MLGLYQCSRVLPFLFFPISTPFSYPLYPYERKDNPFVRRYTMGQLDLSRQVHVL